MSLEQTVDKKIINVNKWKLDKNRYLVSYTALWCKPCKRIKEYINENKLLDSYEHVESNIEIVKTDRPDHVKLIPHFDIVLEDNTIIKSMQSSNPDEFIKFIN